MPFNKLSLFPQIFKSGLHQVNVKTLSIAAVGSFPQKELRRGRPASASDRCGGLEQYLQGVAWSYLPPLIFSCWWACIKYLLSHPKTLRTLTVSQSHSHVVVIHFSLSLSRSFLFSFQLMISIERQKSSCEL